MQTSAPYFDAQTNTWLIDDVGRPRQATPEEVDAYLAAIQGGDSDGK